MIVEVALWKAKVFISYEMYTTRIIFIFIPGCRVRHLGKKMAKTINPRNKLVKVFLTEGEYEQVKAAYEKSMCKTISEYGRRVLFKKVIKVEYRNRSADDAVETNIQILQELRETLVHPSLSSEERGKIIAAIEKIEISTNNIFYLCSQK